MDSNGLFLSHIALCLDNYSLNGKLKGNPFDFIHIFRCLWHSCRQPNMSPFGANLWSRLLQIDTTLCIRIMHNGIRFISIFHWLRLPDFDQMWQIDYAAVIKLSPLPSFYVLLRKNSCILRPTKPSGLFDYLGHSKTETIVCALSFILRDDSLSLLTQF